MYRNLKFLYMTDFSPSLVLTKTRTTTKIKTKQVNANNISYFTVQVLSYVDRIVSYQCQTPLIGSQAKHLYNVCLHT